MTTNLYRQKARLKQPRRVKRNQTNQMTRKLSPIYKMKQFWKLGRMRQKIRKRNESCHAYLGLSPHGLPREKKRKAIEARSQAPVESLVEYEHKRAKGGVAFTVEVDSRPMIKSLLPPIKPRPGPIMLGTDEKLRLAEQKRSEALEKKKQSSKDNDRKKAECLEKKAENEFHFKQKANLTIRYKQFSAEKNRARLQEDRHCSSSLLRAPSTLPPLRSVRVKPSAKDSRDSDEEVFNF